VRENWYSWQPGHVLLFDDSFEHEVRNDTDETRVVLLIRIWHSQLACMERNERESILTEAIAKKEEEVVKRYHPPM
jgi:aspartyl/asparaginyl beta-hydroxylase (cupin superfamily)